MGHTFSTSTNILPSEFQGGVLKARPVLLRPTAPRTSYCPQSVTLCTVLPLGIPCHIGHQEGLTGREERVLGIAVDDRFRAKQTVVGSQLQ
jgi:hypothetical protein